ncbi:uncharacterized protein [Setaria viridis]|uniref:Cathepsin propeptide inhibitor domain-containing protein n=1 Tax=Setaria viridis TaxID=4556 RepID=A0A4U6U1C7_SETVI|nr:uncharacterized protein LOC117863350 [Setaria viridis]TKW07995.1 hypothetical protein SEVIR_7G340601v2 [Setaria viridis]
MGRGCAVALAAAAAALLVSLPMLLVLPPDADTYEQESRRMFMEWKARFKKTYKYAGEEECRYAVFKESRYRVAWARAAGVTTSGLNGLAARSNEEIYRGHGVEKGEGSYEQETRRMFVGWKAKYGKTYRDVGEEECRYRLFKGNRRAVVWLNAAAAAGQNAYDINQFGDLTNEEVRQSCYPEMVDQELSARCQAAAPYPDPEHGRRIWYQVCRCIATEAESGGSAVPGDEAHMWI